MGTIITQVRDVVVLRPAKEGHTVYEVHEPQPEPGRFLERVQCREIEIRRATANAQLLALAVNPPDVVINLCDGAADEDRPGIDVVLGLERLGIPFTGAGSRCFDLSRDAQKMAAWAAGLRVPGFVVVRSDDDMAQTQALRFPLIVKHPRGYNSIGMTRESRVNDSAALHAQVRRMIDTCGSALVEEFVEGREFTVLVLEGEHHGDEPQALLPVEFCFPEGETFKHFDLKWLDYARMTTEPVVDATLADTLKARVAATFLALGLDGYARCDLRMDAAGDIYFLEMNANPSVFYPEGAYGSADLILAADPLGHAGFLARLLVCALRRQAVRQQAWRVGFHPESGFGLVADRAIAAGERVVSYEQRPVNLVSRTHVETHWRGMMREWFDSYAYPVSDRVSAIWSERPEDWRPINHACDPNLWFVGLDYVARRPIATGEPLTSDYATFCGPGMASFECHCGSPLCRGTIRSTDCNLPELVDRYGLHVTDYVKFERARVVPRGEASYEIRPTPAGVGLFAMRPWRRGEKIADLSWGTTFLEPTRWTIQRDEHAHAEPHPHELRYINHSCAPKVFFDVELMIVRAIVDIEPGDEFSFFYPSTEWAMHESFECFCGSPQCLGRIGGASLLPKAVADRYDVSPFIRAKSRARHAP